MTKSQRHYRAFDVLCKKASKCRHETYQRSCFACANYDTCDIQKRIEKVKHT